MHTRPCSTRPCSFWKGPEGGHPERPAEALQDHVWIPACGSFQKCIGLDFPVTICPINVIPAQAGIQTVCAVVTTDCAGLPACAGNDGWGGTLCIRVRVARGHAVFGRALKAGIQSVPRKHSKTTSGFPRAGPSKNVSG